MKSLLAATVLAVSLAGPAMAVELVTGPDYAPFTDPKLPEGGMATDVVKKAYQGIGEQVSVTFLPWKRGYVEATEGKYTGTFPYVATDERKAEFLFSDSLYDVKRKVYLSAASKISYTSLNDVKGRTACVDTGGALPNEVEALIKSGEIKVQRPQDMAACAKMLEAGRADFFIINEMTANDVIKAANVQPGSITVVEKPYAETGQYLIVSKKLPNAEKLLADFNAALKKLKDSGEYDKIVARHLAH